MQNMFIFENLRPYFDLGELSKGPIHARRLQFFFQRWKSDDPEVVGLGMWMPPYFRKQVIFESGLTEYQADSPGDLDIRMQLPSWKSMCTAISQYADLPLNSQFGLAQLLTGLCYYEDVIAFVDSLNLAPNDSPEAANLIFLRNVASQMLRVDNNQSVLMDSMLHLANSSPEASQAKLNACFWLVKQFACLGKIDLSLEWSTLAEKNLSTWSKFHSDFDVEIMKVRHLQCMFSQLRIKHDLSAAEKVLQKGLETARSLCRGTEQQRCIADESLYRLLDQGVQYFLKLSDIEQALKLSKEQVFIDPYSSKAHYEYAEALYRLDKFAEAADHYTTAAQLGPFSLVSTPVSWFMAGVCNEQLDCLEIAHSHYHEAFRYDPSSTTVLERLSGVAHKINFLPTVHWAKAKLDRMKSNA